MRSFKVFIVIFLLCSFLLNFIPLSSGSPCGPMTGNLRSDGNHLYMSMENGTLPDFGFKNSIALSLDSNSLIEGKYCVNMTSTGVSAYNGYFMFDNPIQPNKFSVKFILKSTTDTETTFVLIRKKSTSYVTETELAFIESNKSIRLIDGDYNAHNNHFHWFTSMMPYQKNIVYTLTFNNIVYNVNDYSFDLTISNSTTSQTISDIHFEYNVGLVNMTQELYGMGFAGSFETGVTTLFIDDWTMGTQIDIDDSISSSNVNSSGATITGTLNNDGSTLQNNTQDNHTLKILYDTVSHFRTYETFEGSFNDDFDVSGADWAGQTFTIGTVSPNEAFNLTNISLYCYRVGTIKTLFAVISNVTSENKPGNTNYSTGSIPNEYIGTTNSWITINMTNYTFVPGTKYALYFYATTSSGYLRFCRQTTSGYSGGIAVTSADSGATWSTTTKDLSRFKINGYTEYATNITLPDVNTGDTITKILSSLTAGKLYYYRLYGETNYTNSSSYSYSEESYFLTTPEAPTGTGFTIVNNTQINLSWTKGTGANNTVILWKTTGMPSSISDGTIIYNSTGSYYLFNITNNTNYYLRTWSYTNWSGPTTYQFSINYTNFSIGGLYINCYDASNNTNLTFNVTIINLAGTQTYNNYSVSNTHNINVSLCPQGEITVIISAVNYASATYRMNIQTNIFYLLDSYLNHINKTYLYRLIINNEKGSGEKDVYVDIRQQINSGTFQTITNTTTDSSGYVYIWLDAEQLHIITLSKTGFLTDSDQFIPSTSVFEYTFVIEYIDIVIPPDYLEWEQISFTATRSSTTLTIIYLDRLSQTTNTTIYVYSENSTTGRTLVTTISNISTSSMTLTVTGVNQFNSHIIVLFYNHTTFHSQSRTVIVAGVIVPISSVNKIDTLLIAIIGSNPFGWGNFLMFLFLLAGCYYADERDVGKILVLLGGMFLFINVWLGFNTTLLTVAGGAIPLLFIAVGLLVIWGDSNKKF